MTSETVFEPPQNTFVSLRRVGPLRNDKLDRFEIAHTAAVQTAAECLLPFAAVIPAVPINRRRKCPDGSNCDGWPTAANGKLRRFKPPPVVLATAAVCFFLCSDL